MNVLTRLKRTVYDYRLKNLQHYFASEFKPGKNPLIISGAPRGGTTWVYEVLQAATPSFGIWEPLHPNALQKYYPGKNFWFEKYIPEKGNVPEMEKFLGDVCSGKFITESMLQQNARFKNYRRTSFLLIKFVRLTGLIPWFTYRFPAYKIFHVYRNPIAVVASQMRHGAWDLKKSYSGYPMIKGREYYPEYYQQFKDVFPLVKYPEEMLAVTWALSFIPCILKPQKNVLYMRYEDLFLQPVPNFKKVFDFFDEHFPPAFNSLVKKPSATTRDGSNILGNSEKQLETWTKHLNTEQAGRIREILKRMGFANIGDIDYSLDVQRSVQLDF